MKNRFKYIAGCTGLDMLHCCKLHITRNNDKEWYNITNGHDIHKLSDILIGLKHTWKDFDEIIIDLIWILYDRHYL